jgi:hypothetical protein
MKLKKTDAAVLVAIGQLLDESDPNVWPPYFPTMEEIAEKGKLDRRTVALRYEALTKTYDPPYLKRNGKRYALTIRAIEFMANKGYLRRYISRTDGGWGVRVAKIGLVYPS